MPLKGARGRGALIFALIVLAVAFAVAGGVTLYIREELVNSTAFADRAVAAVHQPTLQRVLAREIAVQVAEPALPDVVAARPLVQTAVRVAVTSKPFEGVIRLAALHGHRLLFERGGGNAVFDIADAGNVISAGLRTVAPKLANEIPKRSEAVLLTLRKRSFAVQTLDFADTVRVLGIVLPAAALLLLAAGIAIAPDRRRAITRSGVSVGVAGVLLAVVLVLLRRYVVSHVYGSQELTNSDVRGAADELWGVYLGDLMTWTLLIAAVAWIAAAASASVLAPYSAQSGVELLRGLATRTASTPVRALRGGAVLLVGVLVISAPTLAARVFAVLVGCLLVYVGAGEVLSATAPLERPVRHRPVLRRRHLVTVSGAATACIAAIVFAVVLTGRASSTHARELQACNGYAQLCDRRLDEVVFAGTHNSMSSADSPGWLIANQDRKVSEQLRDGIRLFKISTHYAVGVSAGRVYTDIAAEGKQLNRVASKLPPAARQALQRFSRSFTSPPPESRRDIWLCHTMCELGATRMVDYLTVIRRFLELNPSQVIVLFDEDYVSERDLSDAFARAGLSRYLATLQAGQPLPTLAGLIRAHRNVVVFAQKPVSGKYAWNHPGFSWIQDTPLGAVKPSQFSCKLSRGHPDNPLLMMNNWADIFPPRPSPNISVVQKAFILQRAEQCAQQRGLTPNLILTDYYNRGGVTDAVAQLNGVAGQEPARVKPVE